MQPEFYPFYSNSLLPNPIRLLEGPVIFYLNDIADPGVRQHPSFKNNSCKQILQQLLIDVFQLPQEKSVIYYTESGKPFINATNFHLSVSYTAKSCLLAFSANNLGIDIECPVNPIDTALINQTASLAEKKYLLSGNTPQRFLKLWTIKEAWFKVLGTGLPDRLYQKALLDDQGNLILKSIGWNAQSFVCPGGETASIIYNTPGDIRFFHWKANKRTMNPITC